MTAGELLARVQRARKGYFGTVDIPRFQTRPPFTEPPEALGRLLADLEDFLTRDGQR